MRLGCGLNSAAWLKPPLHPTNLALIVAAGHGQRAGDGLPKQYRAPRQAGHCFFGDGIAGSVFCAMMRLTLWPLLSPKNDSGLYQAAVRRFCR